MKVILPIPLKLLKQQSELTGINVPLIRDQVHEYYYSSICSVTEPLSVQKSKNVQVKMVKCASFGVIVPGSGPGPGCGGGGKVLLTEFKKDCSRLQS